MTLLHSLWQELLGVGHELQQDLVNLKEFFTKKGETLLAQPGPLRAVFKHLREHHPILMVPGLAVVSKYDDVLEVLSQEAAFSVVEIYLAKMRRETGDFVLGMADTPQYQHERGLMQRVVKPEDLETIKRLVTTSATELVDHAVPLGRMDLVSQLSRVVPSVVVGTYFGTPGPNMPTLQRWMRSIFRDIFLNLSDDAGEREDAIRDSVALNAYLNELIATRKAEIIANPNDYDDFLSRLIKVELAEPDTIDDDTIRRILGGTIVGTVDTNSKAIAQAIDQLLDRPDMLAEAHQAAVAGDDALVAKYVFEALRFNPQNPFLLRHCTQNYVVAKGTSRAKEIPAGSLVIVGTTSAMFDEDKFETPDLFRTDRPADAYIHFGHGNHTCFGRHFAGVVIPGTAQALLRQPNLRRAPHGGHIAYDGAFPDHFEVEFGA